MRHRQEFRGRNSTRDYARDQDATERQKRMDQGAARPRRERTSVRVPGEHDGDVRARGLDRIGRGSRKEIAWLSQKEVIEKNIIDLRS